ncbi:MAG: bifunctional folylpolyglutamate synthase/dihydrofolate synthase [Tenericutes bacterium]|nr:bifunctional folylpolyglutamate synthase/dihydrofolate synthase [Mycoplasmatota bacterium]
MYKDLKEAIHWIETQLKFRPKENLSRMHEAYKLLGVDLSNIKKIHVAGTNGKGSVCAYISNILIEAGYKVGTFTSPYLLRFNERIRYQFQDIEDDELLELINIIYEFNQTFEKTFGENLSFFELITLMSFLYFKNKNVDVMVIEVGLGGLLDSTNVLYYDASLITSIGFDHMKQLGNTKESIAYNKLGILKEGNHLLTTVSKDMYPYFKDYIKKANVTSSFYSIDDIKRISHRPLVFEAFGETYELPLLGDYQLLNALLSIKTIHYLFPNINQDVIQKGLLKTKWAGRFEEIAHNVFIDGAHNTHAIEALKQTVQSSFKDYKVWVLFSALGDKDVSGMLKIIKSFASRLIMTQFPDPRFLGLKEFLDNDSEWADHAKQAILSLKEEVDDQTILIITGSLHFIGYIKSTIH